MGTLIAEIAVAHDTEEQKARRRPAEPSSLESPAGSRSPHCCGAMARSGMIHWKSVRVYLLKHELLGENFSSNFGQSGFLIA